MPEITTTQLNQSVHRAVIFEAELRELAVAAVAAKLGLDALAAHIEVQTTVYTPLTGDKGDRSPRIEVVLIDNHAGKPWAIEHLADGSMSAFIVGDGTGQALPHVEGDGPDPLYQHALKFVRTHTWVSNAQLQKHLRIGYNRAARLLEEMEKAGAVGLKDSLGVRTVKVDHP